MSSRERSVKVEASEVHRSRVVRIRGHVALRTSPPLREQLAEVVRRRAGTPAINLRAVRYKDLSSVARWCT